MTLPVPALRTWVTGDLDSAAEFNSNIRDGVGFALNKPVFQATASTSQSLPNGALTSLNFDTNVIDTYSGHSPTTNPSRYVFKLPGIYSISGKLTHGVNATGSRGVLVAVSTVPMQTSKVEVPAVAATHGTAVASAAEFLVVVTASQVLAGAFVEIQGLQLSGGNLATVAGEALFQVIWRHM